MTDDFDADSRVNAVMADMLATGRNFRAPVGASDIRARAKWTSLPRIDAKSVAALAAVTILVFALVVAGPLRPAKTSPSASKVVHAPKGWVAYSAYGLQLAVPKRWNFQTFGQCPTEAGSLFIGTSQFVVNCPEFRATNSYVSLAARPDQYAASNSGSTAQANAAASSAYSAALAITAYGKQMVVNGVHVVQANTSQLLWVIPSEGAVLRGNGPLAEKVMRTLTVATPAASPATGIIYGTAYLAALFRGPITGRVTYLRLRPTDPILVAHSVGILDGNFWATLSPGTYRFTTVAGSAPCLPVTAKVESGRMVTAPPIVCQGE
jgi:hypothetical protein